VPCIGYAMIESKAIIAKLLQSFKYAVASQQRVEPVWGLVVSPKEEIHLSVTSR